MIERILKIQDVTEKIETLFVFQDREKGVLNHVYYGLKL